jgi:hypothetical protein
MFGPDSNRKPGLHYLNPERLTHVSHGVRSIGVYPVGVDLRYVFQGVDFLGVHLMAGISGGHLTAPTLGGYPRRASYGCSSRAGIAARPKLQAKLQP